MIPWPVAKLAKAIKKATGAVVHPWPSFTEEDVYRSVGALREGNAAATPPEAARTLAKLVSNRFIICAYPF